MDRGSWGPLDEVRLTDDAGNSVTVVPGRGGLVSDYVVGGRSVLYLDRSTLLDPTKNVRGGIPVLFPSPGKLRDDRWERRGHRGSLLRHGFARNLTWSIDATVDARVPLLTMRLASTPETLEQWPWALVFDLTVSLQNGVLCLDQRIANRSAEPMDFALGFHPYFAVPRAEKDGLRVGTDATKAWDNVREAEVPVAIDLGGPEVDLHLLDHHGSESALIWPDGREIRVSASPEFGRWVIWTLPDRDFVCLEPWTSPADALNTGDGLVTVQPKETRALWVRIAAT